MTQKHYFICGIGGTGVSALANILLAQGHKISASDRSRDQGLFPEKFAAFEAMGVTLYPQDGSGVTQDIDVFLTSTAVEDTVPDKKAALDLGIPIQTRPELFADMLTATSGITVSGTSGKSTVTAMAGHIFYMCDQDPTVLCGATFLNDYQQGAFKGLGNTMAGQGQHMIVEACESDSSLVHYAPQYSVITNITLDHKQLDELHDIFKTHIGHVKAGIALNRDDEQTCHLLGLHDHELTFGIDNSEADICASALKPLSYGVSFDVTYKGEAVPVILPMPGRHNVSNALAAMALGIFAGLSLPQMANALSSFKGIKSRLEITGHVNDITVIDDYAHNPDKVRAALETLVEHEGRLLVVFQPHGFAPTKMMKDGYIDSFMHGLRAQDTLVMPNIFFAGGTVNPTISSKDIVTPLQAANKNVVFVETKADAEQWLLSHAQAGDRIVIMGARDDGLRDLARDLVKKLA